MPSRWKLTRPSEERALSRPRERRSAEQRGGRTRPALVTVISVFYGYEAFTSFVMPLLTLNFPASSPNYQPLIGHVVTVAAGVVTVAAAVALWRMRRVALPLLIADWAIGLVMVVAYAVARPVYRDALLTPGRLAVRVVFEVLALGVLAYVFMLSRRGALSD